MPAGFVPRRCAVGSLGTVHSTGRAAQRSTMPRMTRL